MIPIVLGATAVGKTGLLLALSERIPIEVVSLDSRQIYRHMDIGTAKPTEIERRLLKHWMIDVRNPDESFDAKQYREMAMSSVEKIISGGKIPVIAGGTGLYAEVLLKGLASVPESDAAVRNALSQIEEDRPGTLRKLLRRFDYEAFCRIHENDIKRTTRYLEVFFLTGLPLSLIQKEKEVSRDYGIIVLKRSRSELHKRIEIRAGEMLKTGLVEETELLLTLGYTSDLNALKTIGYAEVVQYIRGSIMLERALELIIRNTRRYARRQEIWFRRYQGAFGIDLSDLTETDSVRALENTILSVWGGNYG